MAQHTESAIKLSLGELRENYTQGGLTESEIHQDPIRQFEKWFLQASNAGLKEPNAMTLATVSPTGQPSARIVLLKDLTESGFVFYTNYESRKGEELKSNPVAALVFYWAELERQVRVEGTVSRVSRLQSEEYYKTRPKGSRLGAWVSRQSSSIGGREELEAKLKELEQQYQFTEEVPLPDFWGGYLVRPETVEFWQGRTNRLHDRLRYTREAAGSWRIERLAP